MTHTPSCSGVSAYVCCTPPREAVNGTRGVRTRGGCNARRHDRRRDHPAAAAGVCGAPGGVPIDQAAALNRRTFLLFMAPSLAVMLALLCLPVLGAAWQSVHLRYIKTEI